MNVFIQTQLLLNEEKRNLSINVNKAKKTTEAAGTKKR
jgi:hypothetical protein